VEMKYLKEDYTNNNNNSSLKSSIPDAADEANTFFGLVERDGAVYHTDAYYEINVNKGRRQNFYKI
jgi:hypothetical protein